MRSAYLSISGHENQLEPENIKRVDNFGHHYQLQHIHIYHHIFFHEVLGDGSYLSPPYKNPGSSSCGTRLRRKGTHIFFERPHIFFACGKNNCGTKKRRCGKASRTSTAAHGALSGILAKKGAPAHRRTPLSITLVRMYRQPLWA